MKKTLVLASLLAAFGAASAQSSVTLSGKIAFGYESTKSAAGAKTNGIATTDGDVVITAVEALGNGLTAGGSVAFATRGRDQVGGILGQDSDTKAWDTTATNVSSALTARDASVFLAGGFGRVTLGAIEAGNGILPIGGAGAPVYGLDGPVLAAAANVHLLGYTSPALFPGLTFGASVTDTPLASGGMESGSKFSDSTTFGANYAAGAIAATLNTTNWSDNAAGSTSPKSRVRLAASYNFGVARVGFGYQTHDSRATSNNTTTQMLVGVSAPVGPLLVGLNYATSKVEGASYTAKGLDLGAQYNLSPRTNVAFHYQSTKAAALNAASANKFRVRLMHAF